MPRDFGVFFHDSNPSGSLLNRLNYFRIWFRFRGNDLSGVQHTAEINCTPRNQNRNLHLFLLKRQSGEILFGVNTSIMKKKIEEKNLDLLINFFYVRGVSHTAETTL